MTPTINPIPTYNFSGNLPDIHVANVLGTVSFKLMRDGETLVNETYISLDGEVRIRLRDLLEKEIECPLWSESESDIPKYDFEVAGTVTGSFYLLRGGHGTNVDAESYLRSNFLTWQPQVRRTLYHTPHYLRYVSLRASVCKVQAYFVSPSSPELVRTEARTLAEFTVGKINTVDVSFGTVRALFEEQPAYFDVWCEEVLGETRTWRQRYVLTTNETSRSDYFLFENSLGGWDTIRMSGTRHEINKPEAVSALFDEDTIEYDIQPAKSWKKYTGYFEDDRTRQWALDFFNSCHRFHLYEGSFRRIYVSDPKLENDSDVLSGYEFTFAHARQSRYLNLPRTEIPDNLEIVSPDDELFFLAPRLNHFPRADRESGVILIPVQYATSGTWHVLSLEELGSRNDTAHANDAVRHITAAERQLWNEAAAASHRHANKTVLDSLTSLQVETWDDVSTKFNRIFSINEEGDLLVNAYVRFRSSFSIYDTGEASSGGSGNGSGGYLESVTGSVNGRLVFRQTNHPDIELDTTHTHTTEQIDGLASILSGKADLSDVPVFGNKAVLDGITAAKVSDWNAAFSWGDHSLGGYLLKSDYTASDVLSKLKTVDGTSSGLDADLLDGHHRSSFWGHYSYTVDASQLDENMYYPITILLSASQMYRIEVIVGLNSGTKPSWSTHNGGFSVCFIEEVNGCGWGTSPVNRTILTDSYRWASAPPIGGVTQMTNSSNEVVYVRGGGKYLFFLSHPVAPILHAETFTASGESVSPRSECKNVRDSATGGGMSVGIFQANEGRFGTLFAAGGQEVFHRGNYNLPSIDGVFKDVHLAGDVLFGGNTRLTSENVETWNDVSAKFKRIFSINEAGDLLVNAYVRFRSSFSIYDTGETSSGGSGNGSGGYLESVTGSVNGRLVFRQTNHPDIELDTTHTHTTEQIDGLASILSGKADLSDVPVFGNKAVLDGITAAKVSDWNAAFSWGDHSLEGYLKTITREQVEEVLTGEVLSHWHAYLFTPDLRNTEPKYLPSRQMGGCLYSLYNLGIQTWSDLLWINSYNYSNVGGMNALALSKQSYGNNPGIWHLFGEFGGKWTSVRRLAYLDEVEGSYVPMSEYTASDVLSKLKTVDGISSGLDADLLDGYHRSSFWGHYSYTVDASQLDENMYYPVTIQISFTQMHRISVIVGLNSGTKPSWSTHNNGFSVCFIEEVNGSGWGVLPVNRTILADSYLHSTIPPIGKVTQMINSSNEAIYVRGGAKYFFYLSHPISPVLHSETYTANGQSISPTSESTSVRNSAAGGGMSVGIFQANEGRFGSLFAAGGQEVFHRGNYNLPSVDGVFDNVEVHGEIRFSNGARITPLTGGAVSVTDSSGENEVIVDASGTLFKKGYTIYHS